MVSFFSVIKADPVYYEKEKKRVCDYKNKKYSEDPEYRELIKEKSRQYRLKKKLEKQAQNDINNT